VLVAHQSRPCVSSPGTYKIALQGTGIALHFEEVHCINRAAICTTAGCLHQVYVSKGGPYRIILNVYAPEIELKLLDGAAVVEIACGQMAGACARDFRWDGSHLHPLK
jgi:hypothetical protein